MLAGCQLPSRQGPVFGRATTNNAADLICCLVDRSTIVLLRAAPTSSTEWQVLALFDRLCDKSVRFAKYKELQGQGYTHRYVVPSVNDVIVLFQVPWLLASS